MKVFYTCNFISSLVMIFITYLTNTGEVQYKSEMVDSPLHQSWIHTSYFKYPYKTGSSLQWMVPQLKLKFAGSITRFFWQSISRSTLWRRSNSITGTNKYHSWFQWWRVICLVRQVFYSWMEAAGWKCLHKPSIITHRVFTCFNPNQTVLLVRLQCNKYENGVEVWDSTILVINQFIAH